MRTLLSWETRPRECVGKDGQTYPVYDVSTRPPEYKEVAVAAHHRILLCDATDGRVRHVCRGHTDTVYTVDYSPHGRQLASGGADKTVILWNGESGEGVLKYQHSSSIQCLAYNPADTRSELLASCTASDFGLWSPDRKSVTKFRMPSRVLCCSWSSDGNTLALGLANGTVSLRTRMGAEISTVFITKSTVSATPVWSVVWAAGISGPQVLVCASWDRQLVWVSPAGRILNTSQLDEDPLSISVLSEGSEYLLITGARGMVDIWTAAGGVRVASLEKCGVAWLWGSSLVRAEGSGGSATTMLRMNAVLGGADGRVQMHKVSVSTVHGLHWDRYACRDGMRVTDVLVQDLMTGESVRIPCRDHVQKLAVYRDRVAIQMPDKVCVYADYSDDPYAMDYRLVQSIPECPPCSLLVLAAEHVVLCMEKRLKQFDFEGVMIREWVLESVIRYVKVTGGPSGKEGLLVGLRNGAVFRIFLNNPFPTELFRLPGGKSVRCLDMSLRRKRVAVVDESGILRVYDVGAQHAVLDRSIAEIENASSVVWNRAYENMFCWSGKGNVHVKASTFPKFRQRAPGFVVGMNGSKVFCLHSSSMHTVDIPLTFAMKNFLAKEDFEEAYAVSCLGVPDNDWRDLGLAALRNFKFDIARKAFVRVREVRLLQVLNILDDERRDMERRTDSSSMPEVLRGELLALLGKWSEAAKVWAQVGEYQRIVDMYASLHRWEDATEWAKQHLDGGDFRGVMRRKADVARQSGDIRAAAEIALYVGDGLTAVQWLVDNKDLDGLVSLLSQLQLPSDEKALRMGSEFLVQNGSYQSAKNALEKLGDTESLLRLHVAHNEWDNALKLAAKVKVSDGTDSLVLVSEFWLPYARWLILQGRYDEAQEAFLKANHPEYAIDVINQLRDAAVTEERYVDAAQYCWMLSEQELNSSGNEQAYTYYRDCAEIYYVYDSVRRYMEEAFTSLALEHVFHRGRWILNRFVHQQRTGIKCIPRGVSKRIVLLALAKLGTLLSCFKFARNCCDQLHSLVLPVEWVDEVELMSLFLRGKPYTDDENCLPVCYKCSSVNPLLHTYGENTCVVCGHPFIFSFYSMENLPLVEFRLADGIRDDEAAKLINQQACSPPRQTGPAKTGHQSNREDDDVFWENNSPDGAQVLSLDVEYVPEETDEDGQDGVWSDPFARTLMSVETGDGVDESIVVDRAVLEKMNPSEVFVVKAADNMLPPQYYKLVLPEVAVVCCPFCHHFFHRDDFQFESLKSGGTCPFCRRS